MGIDMSIQRPTSISDSKERLSPKKSINDVTFNNRELKSKNLPILAISFFIRDMLEIVHKESFLIR